MDNFDIIEKMKKEMFWRRYSTKTIRTYCYCVKTFLKKRNKHYKDLTKKDVREFMEKMMKKDYSGNTINVYFNAIRYLVYEVLKKRWRLRIRYSKIAKRKAEFLSKEEVMRLIKAIDNKKHKLMVELMYSAGLRVSELVNLKVKNLNFKDNYG